MSSPSTTVTLSPRSLADYLPAWKAAHTAVERRAVAREAFVAGDRSVADMLVDSLRRIDGPQAARVCERQFATLTQFGGVL